MDLKQKINYILEHYPETRNSDITLMIELWKEFQPKLIRQGKDGELGIYLKDLYELERDDNIKRVRAKIQNEENKFLPTSKEVVKQRKINEKKWLEYMGYKPKYDDKNQKMIFTNET